MPKNIDDKFRFGILKKERSKYGAAGITMDNLPDGYIEQFNEATVDRAKTLKSKHKEKYSDEYYLQMAKQLELRDMIGRLLKNQERLNFSNAINDIQWAQYSYEEIIQMEESGVKIPEEIVAWAHSQQQADETNYVILTENAEAENNSTTEGTNGTNDINELKKRSMKDIAKIEKAEKETENLLVQYNEKSKAAKQIQEEKENTYKDNIEEIKILTDEWKSLHDKQKNGTKLTTEEQKRFEELGKALNGKDGKFMREIQADNIELDSFLDSLDGLKSGIESNKHIAQETIQNAIQLSDMESKIYTILPKINLSSSNETLNNLQEFEISPLAMKEGRDFEQYTNSIAQDLESEPNTKLANFAADYSTLADQAENNTKATMGDDFEKSEAENENKTQKNKYEIDNMSFTFTNAFNSAAITGRATVDLLSSKSDTEETAEKLKKDNQKSLKDIIKLNMENKKTEAQHENYMNEEEEFLAQLETIREQEAQTQASKQMANTTELPEETEENNDTSKQDILDKISDTDNKDQKLKESTQKALLKGIVSNTKIEKTSKNLSKNISALSKINDNTMEVAAQTSFIGTGTFAKSYITLAIGQALIEAGVPMLPNPTTHAQGVGMIVAGDILTNQAAREHTSGAVAIASSVIGMSASAASKETGSNAQDKVKETEKSSKNNKNLFKETQKAMGEQESTNINGNTINENNTNSSATGNTTNLEQNNQIQNSNSQENEEENKIAPTEENTEQTTKAPENNDNEAVSEEKNEEKNNNEDTETQGKNQKINSDLPMGFSAANSVIATAITIGATSTLDSQQTEINKTGEALEKEAKNNEKTLKEAEKQAALATSKHEVLSAEAENISAQVESTQATAENTDNIDEITAAQNTTETLATEYTKVQSQDEQVTQDADKTINSGVIQLAKLQKNSNNLRKDLKDFNSNISNHLDIATKTLFIGTGTGMLGVSHITTGANMITSGIPLMASFITKPEGLALVAAGNQLTSIGTMEVQTGVIAAASATAGFVANNDAETTAAANSAIERLVTTNAKNTDKELKNLTKDLKELTPSEEEPTSNIENKNEEENIVEENEDTDETILAASASTNASIISSTETDDKADKKLTRFNQESIIESRKKKKKVLAVSASSKNRG